MAQQTSLTTGLIITTDGMPDSYASTRATLAAAFVPGREIKATDVMLLYAAYRQARNHFHTMQDLRGKNEFGNLPTYSTTGTFVASQTTPLRRGVGNTPGAPTDPVGTQMDLLFGDTGAAFGGTPPTFVVAGSVIAATPLAGMVTNTNTARSHFHEWTDVTS